MWNDFLVYAVVLEENDLIVDDIGRYFNKSNVLQHVRGYYKGG